MTPTSALRRKRQKLQTASYFVGPVSVNGLEKLCDWCGKAEAMWRHTETRSGKPVYLCFGCGDH